MIGRERSARFGLQGLEDSYSIDSGYLSNFPNSTGSDYICNGSLEYDFVTFEKRFIDVCGSVSRISKILVELLFHIPRRRRLSFLTHCSFLESLSVAPSPVLSSSSDHSYLSPRAKAQQLRPSSRTGVGRPIARTIQQTDVVPNPSRRPVTASRYYRACCL